MSETTIQASITLTALTSGIFPSTRTIKLHEGNETIQVGRASKSLSKNLVAAADNCWVDSAVMSRDHAHLQFDPEHETIFIEDSGSMHGTRVNNHHIPSNDPIPLANGDVVSFGTDVRRGIEVFPECRFRIDYEMEPFTPSQGVTYQLLSDDDDDDDSVIAISDDDSPVQRADSIPTSTPEQITDAMSGALDFKVHEVVETETVMDSLDVAAETAKPFQAHVEPDEDSNLDCVSVASTDYEPSELPIGRGTPDRAEEIALAANIEDHASDEDAASDSREMDSDSDDDWSVSGDEASLSAEFLGYMDEEEVYNINDLPERDPETLKLLQDELKEQTPPPAKPVPDESVFLDWIATSQKTETHDATPPTEPAAVQVENRYPTPKPHVLQLITAEPTSFETPDLNAPPCMLNNPCSNLSPSRLIARPTPPWRNQRVAEKRDKQEFFAAREENRAKLALESGISRPLSATTPPVGAEPLTTKTKYVSDTTMEDPNSCAQHLVRETIEEKPPLTAFEQLVRDYEGQSRVVAQKLEFLKLRPNRAGVSISDIVEQPAPTPPTTQRVSVKRKAGDISGDDVRYDTMDVVAPTASSFVVDDAPALPTNTATVISHKSDPATETAVQQQEKEEQDEQEQPRKKQKRTLKTVAFATVGGFVAGAGCLFAVLVATAPEFDFGGMV